MGFQELNHTIHQARLHLWDLTYTRYIQHEFLSWQWWIVVAFLLSIYVIWWKILDKARLRELLLMGSFIAVMAAVIDIIGTAMSLWQYNVRMFPISPAVFPYDYTVVPITLLLVYQYTNSWRSYMVGTAIASSIISFIIIPFFDWIKVIEYFRWNYFYNFVLYVAVSAFARFLIVEVTKLEAASQSKNSSSQGFIGVPQPAMKPTQNEQSNDKQPSQNDDDTEIG